MRFIVAKLHFKLDYSDLLTSSVGHLSKRANRWQEVKTCEHSDPSLLNVHSCFLNKSNKVAPVLDLVTISR